MLQLSFAQDQCAELWLKVAVDLDAGELRAKQLGFSETLIARLRDALGDVEALPAISFAPRDTSK